MCMGLLNGKAASTLHCLRAGSIDRDAAQYNYIFFCIIIIVLVLRCTKVEEYKIDCF